MTTRTRPELPDLFVRLCRAAETDPWAHAALPATTYAIEKAVREALRAERKGAPLPRAGGLAFGNPSFEFEVRQTIRVAAARLRRLDAQLEALTAERAELAELLKS
jgi:hypothetical protein